MLNNLIITEFKKGRFDSGVVKKVSWEQLAKKLQDAVITNESVAEYHQMPKTKQNEIKHQGGLVAGESSNGNKKATDIINRSIVTLDADKVKESVTDFWDNLTFMYPDVSMVLHTTHSHTKNSARVRVFIPLNRSVQPEEYEAISRKVADNITIDDFDKVSFTVNQMMFYPSVSKDGEFIALEQKGLALDADRILAEYTDWTDRSTWPKHLGDNVEKLSSKKGHPHEIEGLVGAFNRQYDIHKAIETFLPDIYEPTAHDERYTYTHGSTSGGLVVYDDGLFCTSNHSTDPASNEKSLNSFDLVRVHKFGHLDAAAKLNTPIHKLPSSKAFSDWLLEAKPSSKREAESLEEIRTELKKSSLQSALEDFEDILGDETESEMSNLDKVLSEVTCNKNGRIEPTSANLEIIIKGLFGHTFKYDTFAKKDIRVANVPWRRHEQLARDETTQWEDSDTDRMLLEIEKIFNMNIQFSKAVKIVDKAIQDRQFHPVQDFINSKKWDGVERAETLLIDFMGAEDTEYTRLATIHWLTGALARIFNPGVKFDECLTLVGSQGLGKSLFASRLAGKDDWFSDSQESFEAKKGAETLQGKWIIELGELAAMRKSEVEDVKRFLSAQEDTFRPAYARKAVSIKRSCVFIGTTNEVEFLTDGTGNRRFLPIECDAKKRKRHPSELSRAEVQQIWAEIKKRFYVEKKSVYMSDELRALAHDKQGEHLQTDIRAAIVAEYLNKPVPYDFDKWERDKRLAWIKHIKPAPDDFMTWSSGERYEWYSLNQSDNFIPNIDFSDVIELKLPTKISVIEVVSEGLQLDTKAKYTTGEMRAFANIIKQLGWEHGGTKKSMVAYGRQRAFERPN